MVGDEWKQRSIMCERAMFTSCHLLILQVKKTKIKKISVESYRHALGFPL